MRADNILIVKLGAFGDLILAEGAMRDIREHHRAARITLLTRRAYLGLMTHCPWIDRILLDEPAARWNLAALLRLRGAIAAGEFSRIYDLQQSRRTAFYRRWAVPGRVEWSGGASRRRATQRIQAVRPLLQRHARQLAAAGVSPAHAKHPHPYWLAVEVDDLLQAAGLVEPFVVLLPGASARHPAKRWPGYADLAGLLRSAGHTVVAIPGPEEWLESAGWHMPVLRRGPRALDFRELSGVLARAALVIGNDSGPTHLAVHLNRPGIALFNGDSPRPSKIGVDRSRFQALRVADLASLPAADVFALADSLLSTGRS